MRALVLVGWLAFASVATAQQQVVMTGDVDTTSGTLPPGFLPPVLTGGESWTLSGAGAVWHHGSQQPVVSMQRGSTLSIQGISIRVSAWSASMDLIPPCLSVADGAHLVLQDVSIQVDNCQQDVYGGLCTSPTGRAFNVTVSAGMVSINSWQSAACNATATQLVCSTGQPVYNTTTCGGALATTATQLNDALTQLQAHYDNVTINLPANQALVVDAGFTFQFTKQVTTQSTQPGQLAWLDTRNGTFVISPPSTWTLSWVGLMNLAFGPPTRFMNSAFVGYLWAFKLPRIAGEVSMVMSNVALDVPADLYKYLTFWFTRLLSPISSVSDSAKWIAAIPGLNASLTDFQVEPSGQDLIYNTFRRPQGQLWVNVSIGPPSTFQQPLLPRLSHTGVLDVSFTTSPDDYVAGPQVVTSCLPSDLIVILNTATTTRPHAVTACNTSFAGYGAQPLPPPMDIIGTNTSNVSLSLPAQLPAATQLLWQAHPLLPISVDMGGASCVAQLQADGVLRVRSLVLYNGGIQARTSGLPPGPEDPLQNFTSALWTLCGARADTNLVLEHVTLVVPAEELRVLVSYARGAPCNCRVSAAEQAVLQRWQMLSRFAAVTDTSIQADLWVGWRWRGTNVSVTADMPGGAYRSPVLDGSVLFGQPGEDGNHHGVPVLAVALPVGLGVPLLMLLVAGLLLWRKRQRQARADSDATGVKLDSQSQIDSRLQARSRSFPSQARDGNSLDSQPNGLASCKVQLPAGHEASSMQDGMQPHHTTLHVRALGSGPAAQHARLCAEAGAGTGAAAGWLATQAGDLTPTSKASSTSRSRAATTQHPGEVTLVVEEAGSRGGTADDGQQYSSSSSSSSSGPLRLVRGLQRAHANAGSGSSGHDPSPAMHWSGSGAAISHGSSLLLSLSGSAASGSRSSMGSGGSWDNSRLMMSDSFERPGSEYGDYNAIANQDMNSILTGIRAELADTSKLVIYGVLGAGAHGVVYKGEWRGRPVAVKTLLFQEHLLGGRGKQQALQEVAVNSKFAAHPNIVNTYTFELKPIQQPSAGDAGGGGGLTINELHGGSGDYKLYIVQEFCDAGHLKKWVDSGRLVEEGSGQPDMLSVVQVALDLACGLQHVHFKNVIHGDLSPANVLLKSEHSRPGRLKAVAKVGDFGLSRSVHGEHSHVSNVHAGTPFYTAPEVLLHGLLTRAADVFSLGVILHELYCGRPAWRQKVRHAGKKVSAKERLRDSLAPTRQDTAATTRTAAVQHEPVSACHTKASSNLDIPSSPTAIGPEGLGPVAPELHELSTSSMETSTNDRPQVAVAAAVEVHQQAADALCGGDCSTPVVSESVLLDSPALAPQGAAAGELGPADTLRAIQRYMVAPEGGYPLHFPSHCPGWYQELAQECLQADPALRPKLPTIVTRLMAQHALLLDLEQPQPQQQHSGSGPLGLPAGA